METTTTTTTSLGIACLLLLILLNGVHSMEDARAPMKLVAGLEYGCLPRIKTDLSKDQFHALCKVYSFDPRGNCKCCVSDDHSIVCLTEDTDQLIHAGALEHYSDALRSCDSITHEQTGEQLKADHKFMQTSGFATDPSIHCTIVAYGVACENEQVFVAYDFNEADRIIDGSLKAWQWSKSPVQTGDEL